MRGIVLIDSIRLFGFRDGFSFWFRWSFIDPIQMFVWLNITHKPYCTYHGYAEREGCIHKKLTSKKNILKEWAKGFEDANFTMDLGKGKYAPKNMKNKVK